MSSKPHTQADADAHLHVPMVHRLRHTCDILSADNPVLAQLIEHEADFRPRVLTFIDQGVCDAHPQLPARLGEYLRQCCPAAIDRGVHVVPGGEQIKNDWQHIERILRHMHDAQLCRRSYVLVFGGGAVLDAVGFAAATAHRGVRLIRMPTTSLAQADSGVGVKNGINFCGKKNFLGTFTVPWAVINDAQFLGTLSDRDWRCGLAEAVKVALLKDVPFFDALEQHAGKLGARDAAMGTAAFMHCAHLHMEHITRGGDAFELRQARPLDFGHWAAHKLEQMTHFDLRHGEAVAIGLAIDTAYSCELGLLSQREMHRIHRCLETMGFTLAHSKCEDATTLLEGLAEFQQHLGGQLTLTLLRTAGDPVDVHEVDHTLMAQAISQVASCAVA